MSGKEETHKILEPYLNTPHNPKKEGLMNNTFKKYYLSIFISNLGSTCTTFLFPIYILEITKSTFQLSMISAIQLVPFLILGLPFGAVIDKINIKKMMELCDVVRFLNYIWLFIVVMSHNFYFIITSIYLCTIVNGVCYVFHTIAESTLVPFVVSKEDLTKANSLIFGIGYATGFFVPIITGSLYKESVVGLFFLFDALSFLFSYFILRTIEIDKSISERKLWVKLNLRQLKNEISDGFSVLIKDKNLFKMLILVACSNLIVVSYYNGLLDYMKNNLNFSTEVIGIIGGVYSLGALLGSLLANVLTKKINGFKILIGCIGIDALCRLLVPMNFSAIWIAILMVIIELTSAILNIMVITIRQERVETEYLGRINSVFKTILLGINPIGLMIGGFFLSSIGSLYTMKLIAILCSILLFISILMFGKDKSSVHL